MVNIRSFRGSRSALCLMLALTMMMVAFAGCAPTYPKEKFEESIVKLCKNEYKVDVKVETRGKTVAIYLPLEDLIDFTFNITKSASDKINDVILSVSRVALSSDAQYDFYCVVAHDVRIPELQVIIIRSVLDVKRFFLNDISRGEFGKRMLVDMRLSPQAQKERAVKDIFNKLALDQSWQESVLNDFFRSEPTALGDIGYWDNHFYIKDIALPEFLSEQMAGRIRIEFREDTQLADSFVFRAARGMYATINGKRTFTVEVIADPKYSEVWTVLSDASFSERIFDASLKVIAQVVHGYSYVDFDLVTVIDLRRAKMVQLSRDELEAFRKKKLGMEQIIKEDYVKGAS